MVRITIVARAIKAISIRMVASSRSVTTGGTRLGTQKTSTVRGFSDDFIAVAIGAQPYRFVTAIRADDDTSPRGRRFARPHIALQRLTKAGGL